MPPAACTCSACVNEHAVSLPLIFFVSGPSDQCFKTMNSFKRRVKCLCVLGKLPFDVVPATGRVTLYAFHYAPTRRRTTHGNSPKRLRLLTSPLRYWLSKWSHSARSHTRRPVRDALEEYLRPNVTKKFTAGRQQQRTQVQCPSWWCPSPCPTRRTSAPPPSACQQPT